MDLLDTNIWLERLLNQSRSQEVGEYLSKTPTSEIAITDFAFHSIALALYRHARIPLLLQFIQDFLIDNPVNVLSMPVKGFPRVAEIITDIGLDYDDAYQYGVAERFALRIVSFDTDFDSTPLGRTTPAAILTSP